jgi:cyanophycinase
VFAKQFGKYGQTHLYLLPEISRSGAMTGTVHSFVSMFEKMAAAGFNKTTKTCTRLPTSALGMIFIFPPFTIDNHIFFHYNWFMDAKRFPHSAKESKDFEKLNGAVLPKGLLVAVGGNEDKEHDLFVLRKIVSLIKNCPLLIEVITTASEMPEETGKMYQRAFDKINNTTVQFMHICARKQAEDEQYIQRLKKCHIIFFTGGDQLRITSKLGGTAFLKAIVNKYYNEYCIVAGTSAGATAMSQTMIYDGESSEALVKGSVKVTAGIGLIQNVVIDSHFIKRGRFSRLMEIITSNPGHIGIGLGEDTGIIIRKGCLIEAIGNGLVVVFDGKHIRYSNISSINSGQAIAVENMHIHTLVNGYGYNLLNGKFLMPLELQKLSTS